MSGEQHLYERYLETALELARSGRPDPLKELLAARVRGRHEPVQGVVSPPLGRDEPDRNAMLYLVYHTARKEGDDATVQTLRRAAAELLMESLNGQDDPAVRRAFANLVGHYRVVDAPQLRTSLQQQLFGCLSTSMEQPFTSLARLAGEPLQRAISALDVWLAVMPVAPAWPGHQRNRVEGLYEETRRLLQERTVELGPRFELLVIAFRALVKVNPGMAGCRGLWQMCELVQRHHPSIPDLRRRWLGACYRQGLALATDPTWRQSFAKGVIAFRYETAFEQWREMPLLHESLQQLDRLWDEVEPAWCGRRRPPVESASVVDFPERPARSA